MMSNEKARREFEKLIIEKKPGKNLTRRSNGEYLCDMTEISWLAFKKGWEIADASVSAELTAEREAREKAEGDIAHMRIALEVERQTSNTLFKEREVWKQRAESAEQRIKEAQEQEPALYVTYYMANEYGIAEDTPLYANPIPSADMAELQRENAKLREGIKTIPEWMQTVQQLRGENTELTRKLAEQQSKIKRALEMSPIENIMRTDGTGVMVVHSILAEQIETDGEELTKLIEEARKQEREECAKICDKLWNAGITTNITKQQIEAGADHCAAAIRAKGN